MSSLHPGQAPTGEPQKAHQCLQAEVWEAEAEILLDRIGVEPGWRCADLGCGAVGVLEALSRRVGAAGLVIGVDMSVEVSRAARESARLSSPANRHVVAADLLAPALAEASFDLVHTRFTLHLVPVAAALAEMEALAKPGGWLAVEEPDLRSWQYEPATPAWPPLLRALSAAIALHGDPEIGCRVPGLLRAAGLEDVEVRPVALRLPASHPYARLPLAWAEAQRESMLDAGIADEASLSSWAADIEAHLREPGVTMVTPTTVQAWGRRPDR